MMGQIYRKPLYLMVKTMVFPVDLPLNQSMCQGFPPFSQRSNLLGRQAAARRCCGSAKLRSRKAGPAQISLHRPVRGIPREFPRMLRYPLRVPLTHHPFYQIVYCMGSLIKKSSQLLGGTPHDAMAMEPPHETWSYPLTGNV